MSLNLQKPLLFLDQPAFLTTSQTARFEAGILVGSNPHFWPASKREVKYKNFQKEF